MSAVDEDPPDLVLMDIKLKGYLDGIQTSEKIKARHGIPVIYLTAHSDKSFLDRAKVTEPFGYLIKPVEKRELNSAIEMALYKSKEETERKQLINKLRTALAEVKTLRGILPICSICKKIRDDKGYWQQVEKYITERSDAIFSHSICAKCAKEHYQQRQ